jgi:hypothetical protein
MIMKTSTKIVIATMLLLATGLVIYDLQLKAEFRKGDYIKPLYGYTSFDFRHFNRVELRSTSAIDVLIQQGAFKVMAHPAAASFIVIKEEDSTLIVEAHFPDHYMGMGSSPVMYISCPTLRELRADSWYLVGRDSVVDRVIGDGWYKTSTIEGFTEDSLAIRAAHAANLKLVGNHLRKLAAALGEEAGLNRPNLTIEADNHIDSTNLNILGQSRLWIKGTDIRQLTFHLADSASLTVNGVSTRYLNLHSLCN